MLHRNDADYEVAFGKPPKLSQFKKGQSGNPKGRPSRNSGPPATMSDAYLRVLLKPIRAQIDGRTQTISMLEALVRKQVHIALKVDGKYSYLALRDILKLGLGWEKEAGELSPEKMMYLMDTQIAKLRKELGMEPAEALEAEFEKTA